MSRRSRRKVKRTYEIGQREHLQYEARHGRSVFVEFQTRGGETVRFRKKKRDTSVAGFKPSKRSRYGKKRRKPWWI